MISNIFYLKNMKINYLLIIITIFSAQKSLSQNNNEIIDDRIKTVIIKQKNKLLTYNIINLKSTFVLQFDYLNPNIKNLQYEIKLHDINWEESNLTYSQYANGFKKNYINNSTTSFNTSVKYSSYYIPIPNRDIKITKSGNYMITIFDKQKILLKKKFILFENIAQVKEFNPIHIGRTKQKLVFKIDIRNIKDINVDRYLSVDIIKNNNWLNSLKSITPQFIKQNELIYNNNNISFDGGNEFRDFDTKSTLNPSINTYRIDFDSIYQIQLVTDSKSQNTYSFKNDINGNFVTKNIDLGGDIDYTMVTFSLYGDPSFENYDIYVCGLFNQWQMNQSNLLKYNNGIYIANILIKQGFYNYKYFAKDKKSKKIYYNLASRSFYETENEYDIIIYYNPPRRNTYSVVGHRKVKVSFL